MTTNADTAKRIADELHRLKITMTESQRNAAETIIRAALPPEPEWNEAYGIRNGDSWSSAFDKSKWGHPQLLSMDTKRLVEFGFLRDGEEIVRVQWRVVE